MSKRSTDELNLVLECRWHKLGRNLEPDDFTEPRPSWSRGSPEATTASSTGSSRKREG
ncbi:hypothetical protein J7I92_18615 [Arthrobacter sp. ISL-72]|nr:hypothetical protein [Arthrobacter sp. ISL-72]MBT2597209.1 hypothetical protein [Arthrobacter sp. ISL-72]